MSVSSEIIATQGQVVVNTTLTLPASVTDFMVYVNNVLADITSYTRTSVSDITFITPLNENDKIRVLVPFTSPTSSGTNLVYPDSPTLTELYTKVRTEMKVDKTGRIWSNPDIKDSLNLALLNVQKATNFGWQENDSTQDIQTVALQETYTIADNTQSIQLVEYNKQTIYSASKIDIDKLNKTLPTGTPRYYYIWNGILGLSPIPSTSNQTVSITHQKRLIPLEDSNDRLPFSVDFVKAIVLYASYDLFAQTSDSKNIQRAQVKKQRYNEEINTLRLAYWIPDKGQVEYKTSYIAPSRRGTNKIATNLYNNG